MFTRDNRIYLAWLMALIATIASLYLSEVRGYKPCVLCWYQRICMYPLAIMLGVAALRGDHGVRWYALPLAVIGWILALIQNAETWGWIQTLRACSVDAGAVPCNVMWPLWGGGALAGLNSVLTIPVLSMIAFTVIIALLSWGRSKTPR